MNSTSTKSTHEDDSDDDSFNSCVDYLQRDLYDDVLFQHAIVPKDAVEQDTVIMMNESFSSAYSNRSSLQRQPRNNNVLSSSFTSFIKKDMDGESCNSSHLLSSGGSNDDDLSFMTENTSLGDKLGMGMRMGYTGTELSVVSSEDNEEQRENLLHCGYDSPETILGDSDNFDAWSMMSHDDDIMNDLADVTSPPNSLHTTDPARDSPTAISCTDDPHPGTPMGYFAMSAF